MFCRFIQLFALLNLLAIVLGLFVPVTIAGQAYSWRSAELLILVQAAVSMAMLYAAGQTLAGREIGPKTLPASLVSYVLWLGMLRFWWLAANS